MGADGRPVPGQRAVRPVRGESRTRRHPVSGSRRGSLPRSARSEGDARLVACFCAAPGRTFAEHLADLADESNDLSEERREHVDALTRLGREYLEAEGGSGTVDGFLVFLQAALRGDDAATPAGDAVELLTFHRAKGLEFDTVFVTGLERGLVPISHAKTQDALDEEQRLLYVALSRAERALHLSWARQRTVGMRSVSRKPSPWLARVERVIAGREADEPSPDAAAAIADARARISNGERRSSEGRHPGAPKPTLPSTPRWWNGADGSRRRRQPPRTWCSTTRRSRPSLRRARARHPSCSRPGIGPVKVERYGADVLALVVEHASAVTA